MIKKGYSLKKEYMGLEDKLDTLFSIQEKLQELYGYKFPFKDEKKRQEYISDNALNLYVEIGESIKNTKYKKWKKNQEFNEEEFKKELVDCWHFLINLTLASGMDSEDLLKRYIEKNNENKQRINEGY
jgi:dimeric dUTPase (all-alpha-NTP-PPase superfamily)